MLSDSCQGNASTSEDSSDDRGPGLEVAISSVCVSVCACGMCVLVTNCVQLFGAPCTVARQTPLSMEFSRQEYWSGEQFSSPGDLPDPGIEPRSPTLQAYSLPSEPRGKPNNELEIAETGGRGKQPETFPPGLIPHCFSNHRTMLCCGLPSGDWKLVKT